MGSRWRPRPEAGHRYAVGSLGHGRGAHAQWPEESQTISARDRSGAALRCVAGRAPPAGSKSSSGPVHSVLQPSRIAFEQDVHLVRQCQHAPVLDTRLSGHARCHASLFALTLCPAAQALQTRTSIHVAPQRTEFLLDRLDTNLLALARPGRHGEPCPARSTPSRSEMRRTDPRPRSHCGQTAPETSKDLGAPFGRRGPRWQPLDGAVPPVSEAPGIGEEGLELVFETFVTGLVQALFDVHGCACFGVGHAPRFVDPDVHLCRIEALVQMIRHRLSREADTSCARPSGGRADGARMQRRKA